MLKLVMKDLLAARWPLLLILLIGVLFPVQPFWPSEIVLSLGGIYGLIALFTIFLFEDRNKTEIQYLSMPVPRRMIVRARYLLGVLLVIAGGAATAAVSLLAAPLSETGEPRVIITMEIVASFALMHGFCLSVYLACYHRFGLGRGTSVSVVVFIVMTALLAFVLKGGGRSLGIHGILHDFRLSLGMPLFLLTAAAAAVVPFAVSLRLSQRFYSRREF